MQSVSWDEPALDYLGRDSQAGDLRNTLARALLTEGVTAEHELVIRSDKGSQMTSHEFIPVQTPNRNAHIESFLFGFGAGVSDRDLF